MTKRLKDKIALVTGGANGIGEATSTLFSKEGAKVIIVDIDDIKGKELAKQLNAYFIHLDVSAEKEWLKAAKDIKEKFNKLDILVNNAGINGLGEEQNPEYMSIESWHKIHAVNLDSVFLGCKFAISLMKDNPSNCSIINIASRSGIIATPSLAAYGSSKAGIRNYSKSVAIYCANTKYNIRCNTISPAAIYTNMWKHKITDDKSKDAIANTIPLKRMGEPIDVANAILYLASDESLFITGSELIVDGGILNISAASPN